MERGGLSIPARGEPGCPAEVLNSSPKALVIIAITDRTKVRSRRPMTRYRIPRNISYYFSLKTSDY